MDYTLANSLGEPCVPVPNSINSSIIRWAIGNFDCIEIIKSGKGRTHETILIIFNKQIEKNEEIVSTPIRHYP